MSIEIFFSPRSVAVIGASRNPKKVGHVILRNFIEGNYRGKIFPVNPNTDSILGYKCYPSVLKIKDKVDMAVISVPAPIVPKVLDECGRKGVKSAIIISGGFKEVGNYELEEDVKKILKKYGMRAIGPNCIGVYDPYSGVDTFFLPRYKLERPDKGCIAFISQSGALGSVVLDWMAMKNYKISKFISYGNAADVDEADLLEYLAKDKKTRVICVYLEGVTDGRKMFNILKKVAKKKPIVAIKGGVTKKGSEAVSSHTGSLAGSSEIFDAVFKQTGVIKVECLEDVFDVARVLSTQPTPRGNRVQIITDGGGFGVLTVDWISKTGLKLAKMNKKNLEKLKNYLPPHVVLKNPIDLTGDADVERYRLAIDAAMNDDGVDMLIIIALFQIPTLTAEIVDVVASFAERKEKPILFIAAGGRFTEVLKKTLEDNGVPTFSYPEKAVKALKALYDYSRYTLSKTKTK
ncbi:MAG: CoA-binding protein [Candidatus Aenigmatarchaeota archaeon]|nr:MAG: CoA-binding protein [Candidatus Aenigmarchaeota archaeon]